MRLKSWLSLSFLCLCSALSMAQKVKYKDLFVLLNARQFEQAEPFLRRYLQENTDDPNACLFMGMILHEKTQGIDVLTETESLATMIDSAVYYYDLAYKGIDDKELRKNEEYYQAYNRRDLRTGKFGVKLSDVQLDIETRIEGLKDKKERVILLKEQFTDAEALYAKANFLFKDFQLTYDDLTSLYLRSNERTIADLGRLIAVFDSSMTAFNNYEKTSQLVGTTGYNQVLNLRPIEDFQKDGAQSVDFKKDDLRVWDYGGWASEVVGKIVKEIEPLRKQLVAYDIEINKLRDRINRDSASITKDIAELQAKSPKAQLLKFDADPMPVDLFSMKLAELQYASTLVENSENRDSTNVAFQLRMIEDELKDLKVFDSLTRKLLNRNLEGDVKDYQHFVTTAYGTTDVLKSLINGSSEYASRELKLKEAQLAEWQEAMRWVFVGTDSVPLFKDVLPSGKYQPLVIQEEKYTAGLKFDDSMAAGYFYMITPSHRPEVTVDFPLKGAQFTKRMVPVTKGLAVSDASGSLFYVVIYSEEKTAEKFPATVAKIYRTDGLDWTQEITFDFLPSEVTYNNNSGELLIRTSGPSGESKMVILDKNGKIL